MPPAAKPVKPASYDNAQIKHTPGPASSKFTALGIGGKPKIFPLKSVTTHCKFVPALPCKFNAPAGILSAAPSTQNSNGPPNKVPPAAAQVPVPVPVPVPVSVPVSVPVPAPQSILFTVTEFDKS